MMNTICYLLLGFMIPQCGMSPVYAKNISKSVECSSKDSPTIKVSYNKLTVLSFSEKPVKVLSGQNAFDLQFIKNDLALKAISTNSATNLFVYLKDETCVFQVRTTPHLNGGNEVVIVRSLKGRRKVK